MNFKSVIDGVIIMYRIKREYKIILQNTFTKLSFFRSWTIHYKIPFIE